MLNELKSYTVEQAVYLAEKRIEQKVQELLDLELQLPINDRNWIRIDALEDVIRIIEQRN
jgi:hypothetical protein